MEVSLAIMQQLGDKLKEGQCLSDIAKIIDQEALLLDPIPLLLCAHTLVPSRHHVQGLRMKHWDSIKQEIDDLHERRDIRVLQERTRFDSKKLKALRSEFKALSMDGSGITFLQFQQVLNRVLPHWAGATNSPLERIFEVFDEDADKILSFQELICGLAILYQGTLDDKLLLIFKSFATKNKNYLTLIEARAMCEHVYRTWYRPIILNNLGPSTEQQQGDEIRVQLTTIVEKAFEGIPSESDGLSIEGLKQIVIAHPIILECFQPSATPTSPSSLYSTTSLPLNELDEDSLHFVDQPPSPPPALTAISPISTTPPTSPYSLRDFASVFKSPSSSTPASPTLPSLPSISFIPSSNSTPNNKSKRNSSDPTSNYNSPSMDANNSAKHFRHNFNNKDKDKDIGLGNNNNNNNSSSNESESNNPNAAYACIIL